MKIDSDVKSITTIQNSVALSKVVGANSLKRLVKVKLLKYQQQNMIYLSFILHASITGGLFTRLPEVQLALDISEGIYGLVLLSIPLGVFAGSLIVPALFQKLRPQFLICIGLVTITVLQIFISVCNETITLASILFSFGFGFSLVNVSINVVATEYQSVRKEAIMSKCHGWWALSFLASSLASAIMVNLGFTPLAQFGSHAIPIVIGAYLIFRTVPENYTPPKPAGVKKITLPNKEVLFIGLWGFSGILMEATTRGWIVIYARDLLLAPEHIAVLALPTIVLTQTLGRFTADRLIVRFGILNVAKTTSLFLLLGVTFIAITNNLILAFIGFLLIGIGISISMPEAFAAASRIKSRSPSENVAAFSTLSTLLGFIGPPLFGLMAETIGLRVAFLLVIPLVIISFIQAKRLK